MVEIRAIFGDDDRENEQFLGFYLDNIEEAEERYIRQLDVLNDYHARFNKNQPMKSVALKSSRM
jgi:hypothetical protein